MTSIKLVFGFYISVLNFFLVFRLIQNASVLIIDFFPICTTFSPFAVLERLIELKPYLPHTLFVQDQSRNPTIPWCWLLLASCETLFDSISTVDFSFANEFSPDFVFCKNCANLGAAVCKWGHPMILFPAFLDYSLIYAFHSDVGDFWSFLPMHAIFFFFFETIFLRTFFLRFSLFLSAQKFACFSA